MVLRGGSGQEKKKEALTFKVKLVDVFQRLVDKVKTSKSLKRKKKRGFVSLPSEIPQIISKICIYEYILMQTTHFGCWSIIHCALISFGE